MSTKKPELVWILQAHVDYEGSSIVSVFRNESDALTRKAAEEAEKKRFQKANDLWSAKDYRGNQPKRKKGFYDGVADCFSVYSEELK